MNKITRKFYQEYITFNKYIEFRMFNLTKFYKGRNVMTSAYANSIEDVESIMKLYDNDNYIVYFGSNPRMTKSRISSSVKNRRNFFFDIEASGEKPPLTDKVYYEKLMDTAKYIWKKLITKGIYPNILMESGRGIHVSCRCIPMDSSTYEERFRAWIKETIKELMEERPHEDIKFDDAMTDLARIESAPGFKHNKYPEKPLRKILVLHLHENNLHPLINMRRSVEIRQRANFPHYRKKYNDFNFYESPEWLLLANNPDLPEGEIHNKLILTLKILARDNNLDKNKLQMKLMELGYNEVVDTPPPEYQYSPWIMFIWAMNNSKFCLERKIVLPQPFEGNKYIQNIIPEIDERCPFKVPIIPIDNFTGVMKYIRSFNQVTAIRDGDKLIVFYNILWKNIKEGLGEKHKHIYDYIKFLKLDEHISGAISTLDREKPGGI